MAYCDLREFLARLKKNGQLKRITAPVNQDLEITEIADRVTKVTSVMKGAREQNVALLPARQASQMEIIKALRYE